MTTPDPDAILATLEAMGPEALVAMLPSGPHPSTYLADPTLARVETHDVAVPGAHGPVASRRYRDREAEPASALVWVHGGGFAAGDLDMAEAHWVSLSVAARGFAVLSVDYRKCLGGVHYPAPSDDVLAAWPSARATPQSPSLVLAYPTLHPELPPMSNELADATEALRGPVPMQLLEYMQRNYAGSDDVLADPYAFPGSATSAASPRVRPQRRAGRAASARGRPMPPRWKTLASRSPSSTSPGPATDTSTNRSSPRRPAASSGSLRGSATTDGSARVRSRRPRSA